MEGEDKSGDYLILSQSIGHSINRNDNDYLWIKTGLNLSRYYIIGTDSTIKIDHG